MESDRKAILLKACLEFLTKQSESLLFETVHYDGVDCDGFCLIDDIRDELNLEK